MKKNKSALIFRFAVTILLTCVSLLALGPFIYLLITSFVDDMSLVFKNGIALKIKMGMLGISNYEMLYKANNGMFFSWFKNSVLIAFLYTVISISFSSLVGYAVAMYQFKWKKFIIIMILSTMMIPIEALMVPLYNEIRAFKLLNTYLGVVLPFAVSSFTIYFFLQYAQTLSKDFMDAARMDGCGEFGIFIIIMAPLMKPAYASMIILQATTAWNDFLWPLIVMSKNTNFTLTVGLQTQVSPYGNNYNLLFSGAVLSVVPVVILFFVCQRLFMEGMVAGGIKG